MVMRVRFCRRSRLSLLGALLGSFFKNFGEHSLRLVAAFVLVQHPRVGVVQQRVLLVDGGGDLQDLEGALLVALLVEDAREHQARVRRAHRSAFEQFDGAGLVAREVGEHAHLREQLAAQHRHPLAHRQHRFEALHGGSSCRPASASARGSAAAAVVCRGASRARSRRPRTPASRRTAPSPIPTSRGRSRQSRRRGRTHCRDRSNTRGQDLGGMKGRRDYGPGPRVPGLPARLSPRPRCRRNGRAT
jgi:hypothetical protein